MHIFKLIYSIYFIVDIMYLLLRVRNPFYTIETTKFDKWDKKLEQLSEIIILQSKIIIKK